MSLAGVWRPGRHSSRRKGCEHNTHSERQNLDLPPELVTYMECLSVEESKEFGTIENNSRNLVQVCTSSSPCLEEFKDFGATIQNNSEKLVPICTGCDPYVEGFEDFGSTIENYSEKLESGCTSSIPYMEGFEEIGATIQNNSENFGPFMSYGGADDDFRSVYQITFDLMMNFTNLKVFLQMNSKKIYMIFKVNKPLSQVGFNVLSNKNSKLEIYIIHLQVELLRISLLGIKFIMEFSMECTMNISVKFKNPRDSPTLR